jgi:actin related protein 2/3 complex subunit 2
MGAPIRKALNEIKEESKDTYTLTIPYRSTEKYWVKKGENSVILFFSINFSDATDIALAKIMCGELKDTKKISSQAATVGYYQKESQNAELYQQLGVTQKDASCGVISLAITSIQVKKNLETAVYFLTTFRQYMEYHIRMVKCLLHNKMRNRIAKFEIVFEKALREGITSKVDFKTTIGGKQVSDKNEEEKVNVLSKKKAYDESKYTIG